MKCPGDASKLCGNGFTNNVYQLVPSPVPKAFQSGNALAVASRAIDGKTGNGLWGSNSCTEAGGPNPWWAVDFGTDTTISSVDLFNRMDCCSGGSYR